MKNIIALANWKSNKNVKDAETWLKKFSQLASAKINFKGKIILCAPFIDLPILKKSLPQIPSNLNFFLGSQNISAFEDGPYTGEISAGMLKDLVSYVLIGHSERRTYSQETNEQVNQKIKLSTKYGLKTIICVSELSQVKSIKKENPSFKDIILYEPPLAISNISGGKADSPIDVNKAIEKIKSILDKSLVIYGGSVNPDNVLSFISQPSIDGVGVGAKSLEPQAFWEILENVGRKS